MKSVDESIKYLGLDTWAGRRYYKVQVLGETKTRVRIKILNPGGVKLPRRFVNENEVTLVPKYALFDPSVVPNS